MSPSASRASLGATVCRFLAAFVLPSRCALCSLSRADFGGGGVCRSCWDRLPRLDPAGSCRHCALPGGPLCAPCATHPRPIEKAVAFGPYAGSLAKLVGTFKFHGHDILARPAGRRLAELAQSTGLLEGAPLVAGIPSTRRRNRQRGYDPGPLLAEELARVARLPSAHLLDRSRDTVPQSGLPASRRAANVAGAFRAARRACGRQVLLVDDVVTTGATAFAAAEALLLGGAKSVSLLALSRTPAPGAASATGAESSGARPGATHPLDARV